MQCHFVKMQGLGNDFVVLDLRARELPLEPARLARLADRRYGVGCDQILVLNAPTLAGSAVRYRVFNADGTAAEHCGNGVRCVARYLQLRGEAGTGALKVQIGESGYGLELLADGQVRVEMGVPEFTPARIPLAGKNEAAHYELSFEGRTFVFGAVSMGNPHAVFRVDDIETAPVASLGAFLQSHPLFPARVNAGFLQIADVAHARLRVFERGVGETPACGTGACAAVAVGRLWGLLEPEVLVTLRGGQLRIRWAGPGSILYMTGPAEEVFEGNIAL